MTVDATITVRRPHVPTGPDGVPADWSDADYLREAVRNIKWATEHHRGLWGSGVTAMVVQLLGDAAEALDRPDAPQPATAGDAVERAWEVRNAHGLAATLTPNPGQRERDVVRDALIAAACAGDPRRPG